MKVTYLPADSKGRIAYDELENAYEPETKAVVIMHASNPVSYTHLPANPLFPHVE